MIVVLPKDGTVCVDGVTYKVEMPADDGRPIVAILWDGEFGQIDRRSAVPGRIDIEHFMDAVNVLEPYLAAWEAARDRAKAAVEAAAAAEAQADAAFAAMRTEPDA